MGPNRENEAVIRHKSPVDVRPFQPKAALDRQQSLEARYGRIAIDELVAALHHIKPAPDVRSEQSAKAA